MALRHHDEDRHSAVMASPFADEICDFGWESECLKAEVNLSLSIAEAQLATTLRQPDAPALWALADSIESSGLRYGLL